MHYISNLISLEGGNESKGTIISLLGYVYAIILYKFDSRNKHKYVIYFLIELMILHILLIGEIESIPQFQKISFFIMKYHKIIYEIKGFLERTQKRD